MVARWIRRGESANFCFITREQARKRKLDSFAGEQRSVAVVVVLDWIHLRVLQVFPLLPTMTTMMTAMLALRTAPITGVSVCMMIDFSLGHEFPQSESCPINSRRQVESNSWKVERCLYITTTTTICTSPSERYLRSRLICCAISLVCNNNKFSPPSHLEHRQSGNLFPPLWIPSFLYPIWWRARWWAKPNLASFSHLPDWFWRIAENLSANFDTETDSASRFFLKFQSSYCLV